MILMQSSRLKAICSYIKPGSTVADIGSDHALLPLYLIENELSPWVIASEFGNGPFIKMQRAINAAGCRERIFVRQGSGLESICPGEADYVVIAGMGGDIITDILASDWNKAETFSHFLLQPMSRGCVLRRALAARGWPIVDETLVMEKGQFYVIIESRPGREVYRLSDVEEELGPLVLKGSSPLKKPYLNYYLDKYKIVCDNLARSPRAAAQGTRKNMISRLRELEAIMNESQG
ncbi:MAG: SAM-dependent methyltransferase [Syntrophomonadaceae bacterium]|nr:SAM-dependent methyltransferase [Syntrophomonadaceae bacterium]